jgi:hypothetical protein
VSKSSPQPRSPAGIGGNPPQPHIADGGRRSVSWRLAARHVHLALLTVLAIAALAYLLRPIMDPDFFWHLKTGAGIWEHRGLPKTDPFNYTNAGIETPAARFTLTSYWISQLLFHLVHSLGGFTGIVLLRFFFAAALLAAVWRRLEGDAVVSAALLLVFAVLFLELYAVERPQVLSFICFAALLVLLERVKSGSGRRASFLIPPLLLFWANAHGGAILGQVTIAVYLVAEGVKFAHRSLRPIPGAAYRALLIAGGAGLAASLVNPNTFHSVSLEAVFPGSPAIGHGTVSITEYRSMVEVFVSNRDYTVVVVWFLMLLVAVAIAAKPSQVDITEAVLVAGSGYSAFRHTRYEALFMIVALPVIGRFLSQGAQLRPVRAFLATGAIVLACLFAGDEQQGLQRLRRGEWVGDAFPVAAADFISASGLRGNMYNFYNWGGYLIWRLAPARKVFIDGRNLNPSIHWESSVINIGFEAAGPNNWKTLLDRYGVGYAVIPVMFQGQRLQLFDRLHRDRDWLPVFGDGKVAVFARISLQGR